MSGGKGERGKRGRAQGKVMVHMYLLGYVMYVQYIQCIILLEQRNAHTATTRQKKLNTPYSVSVHRKRFLEK